MNPLQLSKTNYLILVLSFFSLTAKAQVNLKFDKRFVECEDQWVAFKMNADSSYNYGFIYIDAMAGLTLNSEGSFKPNNDGSFELTKPKNANLKVRLEPNNVKVGIIPAEYFSKLEIKAIPEWLEDYKTDINTAKRQYNWGYMYNGWNECERALPFLKKAKELDPDYPGLSAEIAFSYNCLKEYESAVTELEEALGKNPTESYLNKEYIFSLAKMGDIDKACTQFRKAEKTLTDHQYTAENCFNIMQFYYEHKDKKNFSIWYKELKEWPTADDRLSKYAKLMKDQLD